MLSFEKHFGVVMSYVNDSQILPHSTLSSICLSIYHFIFCIYLYISTYHLLINLLIDKLSFKFNHPSYKRSFVYHRFIYLSIHAFIRYNRQKSMAIGKQGGYLPCERTVMTVVSEVMMYKEKTRREHEDCGPVTQGPI